MSKRQVSVTTGPPEFYCPQPLPVEHRTYALPSGLLLYWDGERAMPGIGYSLEVAPGRDLHEVFKGEVCGFWWQQVTIEGESTFNMAGVLVFRYCGNPEIHKAARENRSADPETLQRLRITRVYGQEICGYPVAPYAIRTTQPAKEWKLPLIKDPKPPRKARASKR